MSKTVPQWLLDARAQIEANMDNGGGAYSQPPPEGNMLDEGFSAGWDRGYWGGYWDASRHALKALPPYVKWPDSEDWREEGFDPPGAPPEAGASSPQSAERGMR